MRPVLIPILSVLLPACASDRSAAPSGQADSATTTTEASAMTANSEGLYALSTTTLDGKPVDLSAYDGKVTLVVNVASECGFTPQYAGLQALHEELEGRGFAVLGFPSNEFGGQEPGSPEQIREFCSSRFGVTFPMFAKCEVKPGTGQSPVYGFLQEQTGEVPSWNFCKYLVGRDGVVIAFYGSRTAPDAADLRAAIEKALG
jgi:glutathione peroxidase